CVVDESRPSRAIGSHCNTLAAAHREVAKFKRREHLAGPRIDRVKCVEYVDENPARPLAVEHFDEGVAVPAKPVERECPLTGEHAGGVREAQVGRHEIGAITVALLDSAISRGEVRADWAL